MAEKLDHPSVFLLRLSQNLYFVSLRLFPTGIIEDLTCISPR